MDRMKWRYGTDVVLVPSFLGVCLTGFALHGAVHREVAAIEQGWREWHIGMAICFGVLLIVHLESHWRWYQGWIKAGLGTGGKKRWFIGWLSMLSGLVIVSGILTVFQSQTGSSIGLVHYKMGFLLGVTGILHVWRRRKVLARGVAFHWQGKKPEPNRLSKS